MQTDRTSKLSASTRSPDKRTRKDSRARTVLQRPAATLGWDTSDEHETELRRWRGRTEITTVEPMEPAHPTFGSFRTQSESGTVYEVEIRSLDDLMNTFGCIDHRVNGLGTCKHIKGVLAGLRRRGVRAFRLATVAGSQRVGISLRRDGAPTPILSWPRVES
jgi:hypothetical protein